MRVSSVSMIVKNDLWVLWLFVYSAIAAASSLCNGLRSLPNASYTLYDYNNVGALSSLINKKSDGTVRSTFDEFGYDGVFNNLGFDADYASSTDYTGTKAYEYDTKDRLTSEARSGSGPFSFTFAYDAAGNPTTFKGATRTYNIDNQRTSSSSYIYDGNGNPTTYAGSTLAYDRENRLTSAPSFTAGYRADGLRAYKGSGTNRRYYLYDGGNVVCELTAAGDVASFNDYAPDGLVARMDNPLEVGGDDCTSNRGSSTSSLDLTGETLFLFDPQGSVAHRLGTSEGVLANSHYDAYGVESADATVYDPFGYNAKHGYYLDRETGLYLCQHRYYDPGTGRWLTRDPMGFSGGLNLYGYCGSGPVGWVDRNGLMAQRIAESLEFAISAAEASGDAAKVATLTAALEKIYEGAPGAEAAAEEALAGISEALGPLEEIASEIAAKCSQLAPEIPVEKIESAVEKVLNAIGRSSAAQTAPGKFGSPQWGAPVKEAANGGRLFDWGIRFDPGHVGRAPGSVESGPHINWWDWPGGIPPGSVEIKGIGDPTF